MHTTKFKRDRRRSGPRLTLPANPEPPDTICFPVELPYDFANPTDSLWWIATFTGQLRRLGYRFEYQSGETDAAFRTARTWRGVVEQIHLRSAAGVYCDDIEQPDGEGCLEIGAFHPAIEYFPNHPILTPNAAPIGPYGVECWLTGAGFVFADANDAMINPLCYTASLTDLLAYGLPSMQISFSGAGEVDIHFLSQPQGGWAWVFPDGNPLLGTVVDLSFANILDLISVEFLLTALGLATGEQDAEVVHTMEFETTGDHTITAWFFPAVGVEPPFVGAGAGVRKVQFCGEISVLEDAVMPYTLEFDGCDLSLVLDGIPVNTVRVMTPAPDCAFENTVKIQHDEPTDFNALKLININQSPVGATGASLDLSAYSSGVVRNQAQLTTNWNNPTTGEGQLDIGIGHGGNLYDLLRLNNGAVGALIRSPNELGHSTALRIQGFTTYQAGSFIDAYMNAREFWRLDKQGRQFMFPVNVSANSVVSALALAAFSDTVTPAAGYGVAVDLKGQSSTTEARDMARFEALWGVATDSIREARLRFRLYSHNGSVLPLQLGNASGESLVGIHGKPAVPKPTISGSDEATIINNLLAAMDTVGYIDDQTNLMSGGLSILGALGDRNLPPTSVDYECLAANWVAGEIYAHIATAFPLADFGAKRVYDEFRVSLHGFDLQDLYVFANNVAAAGSPAGIAIQAEIVASYPDFVPAIFNDLYDPDAIAAWVTGYSGYGAGTKSVLPWLLRAFTQPTWLELLYTGSLFGVENFSCDGCSLTPISGDWAVEWTNENDDFQPVNCGNGWSIEFNCPPGDASVDLQFTIAGPPATEFTLTYAEIEIAYTLDEKTYFGFVTTVNGSFTMSTPGELDGSGTYTFTAVSGGAIIDTGDSIEVSVFSSQTPDIGDNVTITRIRIEGTGTMFESNGDC